LVANVDFEIWLELSGFSESRVVTASRFIICLTLLFGKRVLGMSQLLKVLLTNLFNIVIVIASIDVLILEECLGMAVMLVFAHLAAHFLALIARKNNFLIEMH
jgi:hypothetical protein